MANLLTEKNLTTAQKVAKMEELRASAYVLVKAYNEATQTASFAEASKIDEALTDTINEYTHYAREAFYDHLAQTEDPMVSAILALKFKTIGKRDRKDGEEKIPVREIVEVSRDIDFTGLHRRCNGIGKQKTWYEACQKLNYLHTRQTSFDIGYNEKRFKAEIGDLYRMANKAEEIPIDDISTDEAFELALRLVVAYMIGDDYAAKVSRIDVKFADKALSKLSSREVRTIESASHRSMVKVMAYVCNHLVTGDSYNNLTKELNKQK